MRALYNLIKKVPMAMLLMTSSERSKSGPRTDSIIGMRTVSSSCLRCWKIWKLEVQHMIEKKCKITLGLDSSDT